MVKKTSRGSAKVTPRVSKAHTSLGYWQSIIDSFDDAVIIIGRDFRVIYANDAGMRQYRVDGSEVIGQHCYQLLHGASERCDSIDSKCPAYELWQTGKPAEALHIYHSGTGHKKEKRYVEEKASPTKNSRGDIKGAVLVIRDVTEAERLKQRILEANCNLAALNVIAYMVSQSLALDTILNNALDRLLDLTKVNVGGILLLDPETQTLSYQVYRGLSEEFTQGIAGQRLGEGIAGIVAQQREPICVDDISKEPKFSSTVVIREGLRAFASLPILAKGKVLGVINIASRVPQRFTPQDIQLLTGISNQIAAAFENAILYEKLKRKEEMRGDLLNFIISTQEEDRRRIARELHDEISQALTSLAVNLEAVAEALPLDNEQVKARLKGIQSTAINTLDEIHKVIWELRPTLLDDLGLTEAVEWLAETNLEVGGVKVHLETAGAERRLPNKVETALFRIIQEAITNISRHAEADSASISLEFNDDSVGVHIEDDGLGFDFDKAIGATRTGRGLGLLSMMERVELLGGTIDIKSQLGQGTQINIEIPVNWKEIPNV